MQEPALNINKYTNFDLATAINSIGVYSGTEGDPEKWAHKVEVVARIAGLPVSLQLDIALLALRGKAQDWALGLMHEGQTWEWEVFKKELIGQFSSQTEVLDAMNRFFSTHARAGCEEYMALLSDADILARKGTIQVEMLVNHVVARAPMELKAILNSEAHVAQSWSAFRRQAEKAAWIAFPEKIVCNTEIQRIKVKDHKDSQALPKSRGKEKFCILHGKAGHFTRECKKVRDMEIQEITINDTRTHIQTCESEDISENKKDFIYVDRNENFGNRKNPYFIILEINNRKCNALIDTGADLSVASREVVPELKHVVCAGLKLKSVCGGSLRVLGKALGVNAKCEEIGSQLNINLVVIEGGPQNYIILGADAIKANPGLIDIIKDRSIDEKQPNAIRTLAKNEKGLENLDASLSEFRDLFKTEIDQMSICNAGKHIIKTQTERAICNPSHRIPFHYQEKVEEEIQKNLRLGIIRPSSSSWCSAITPVTKKDGSLRMCIDYRPLNRVTVKDAYPMPRIDEILDSLCGATVFSTLDATSGYYQLAMDEKDIEKTAFGWKGGLYEFTRMPFGLCNAPATFQRAMDKIFAKEKWKFVIPYLDDIIVFSKTREEHEKHLKIILGKIRASGLCLNPGKCKFYQSEVKILGNMVSKGIVKPDPGKVQAIKDYTKPGTVRELRSFLGLANYCRDYIAGFTGMSAPLTDLLKNESKRSVRTLVWNEEASKAFKNIKNAIVKITYRAQPDFRKDFVITTDASNEAIGAILAQVNHRGKEEMISAFSKKLDAAQKNYSTTDKELLAVVKGLEH